jgi:hypothetical protein
VGLSIDNLSTAVAALGDRLGEREPTQYAERKAAQERKAIAEAKAAEEARKAAVAAVDPTAIPASITRRMIVQMGTEDTHALIEKYGRAAVTQRLNEVVR